MTEEAQDDRSAGGQVCTRILETWYNMLGQEVARPVDGEMTAGFHSVSIDANSLPSGVYLYRITAGTFTETKRMVVAK